MSSEDLIDRAWAAFDEESFDEAEAFARRALMIDPDSIEARIAAARSLVNRERHAEALPLLREAEAIDPDDPETRAVLGIALFEMCMFEEALDNLRRASRLGADSPDVHYWLGLSLERRGEHRVADECFERAHRLEPDDYPLPMRIARAEFMRAVEDARARLPKDYDPFLENVAIRVEDLPDEAILRDSDPPLDPCLLGLFVGVPVTEKGVTDASPHLPDMVFIFQRNLERLCSDRETLVEEISKTLYHEIGHYMGRDEDELEEMGMG